MSEPEKDITVLGIDSIEKDIFDRQKRLKGWDQEKINNASVLVVGAGATGNELIKNLVLMGIGKIYLVDFDYIERSNLNRCVFFKEEDAEKKHYKADVVAKNAKEYGRSEIVPLITRIEEVDKKIYQDCTVTASCLDNLEARLQLNSYSYFYGIPFVDSGIDGFMGSIFCVIPQAKDKPCLQCGMSSKDLENMWRKYSCTGHEITEQGDTSTTNY
ncbi:MAG: ThiF family adenylyltransferase [Promethearchaeota archaeon]